MKVNSFFSFLESRQKSNNSLNDLTNLFLKHKNFHLNLKTINVIGTNGKGTTSKSINNILIASKKKTGLFISPHVLKFNERIQVNNKMISTKDFVEIGERYKSDFEKLELNFFSIYYFIAMRYFFEHKCEYVVLEAGIGGEKDSTSVSNCDYVVLTSVSLDHQELLGNKEEDILISKIKIAKPNSKVFVSNNLKRFSKLIKDTINNKINFIPIDFVEKYHELYNFNYLNFNLSLSTYLANYLKIKQVDIVKGLETKLLPARMEEIQKNIFIDGAHNIEAISNLVIELKNNNFSKKDTAVIFSSIRNDYDIFFNIIKNEFPNSFYYNGEFYKCIEPKKISKELLIKDYDSIIKKYKKVVFCGSFYFVSKIREELK